MIPASPYPPRGHSCKGCSIASSTTSISQSRSSRTEMPSRLTIDPGKETGLGSISNSGDLSSSLNQLQGVVVESLETPAHSKLGLPSEDGTTNGAMHSFGCGIIFEPEHNRSTDSGTDGGVAWLLYHQRSRSAGEISSNTYSHDTVPSSPHVRVLSGQTNIKSSANKLSNLFNKLAAFVSGSSDHSSTVNLDTSGHGSLFRKRLSSGNSSPSSILAISTSSHNAAARARRELDGVQSIPFFNHQHHTMMSASSPASTVSDVSQLPPLSTASTNASSDSSESHNSTCTTCSYASTSSHSTVYTTTSSTASTLCHHHQPSQRKERSRRTGMRKFIRWTRNLRGGTAAITGADTRSIHKTDTSSPTTLSSKRLRGANSAFFQPRDGPSLKELSGRSTRYYEKGGIPVAPAGGADSWGRGRKGSRKVDAKALFSNERTFMHWIKFGLLLGTMALNLTSFGHAVGLNVGLFLVLVAMATLVYSTTIFHVRHGWMAKMRQDKMYYDRIGPSVLFMALFFAYATNVALTMRKMFGDFTEESSGAYFDMTKGPLDI